MCVAWKGQLVMALVVVWSMVRQLYNRQVSVVVSFPANFQLPFWQGKLGTHTIMSQHVT